MESTGIKRLFEPAVVPLKNVPGFFANATIKVEQPIDIALMLAKSDLFLAEILAVLAQMPSMSAAGEFFIGPDAVATPAIVTAVFFLFAHEVKQSQ